MNREARQFSIIERIFSIVTSIRPGEGKSAMTLSVQSFLTMFCYYLIRPAKDALILAEQGAEVRNYATGAQTLLLLVLIPLYGVWFRKNTGSGMIQKLNLFFATNLLLFYLAFTNDMQIGIIFYIWVAIFNVMVVAQFWAFSADLYNVKSGQRLFIVIMLGASLGALAGSRAAVVLIPLIDIQGLILLAAGVLILTLVLSTIAKNAIPSESSSQNTRDDIKPKVSSGVMGGFSLVARDPYLILIAIFMVLLNWIGTNGDYVLSKFVLAWAEQQITSETTQSVGAVIGGFYADYNFWVSVLSLLLQVFLVSRLFKWIGIRGSILILPIVMVVVYGLMFIIPVFSLFRWAKITELGINHSIANTSRHALFLPVSRDAKYEAKMAIDTFFWRFGDLLSAATVFIGVSLFGLTAIEFILINFMLSIFMVFVALKLGQYHHQKMTENVMNEAPVALNVIEDLLIIPGQSFEHMIHEKVFYDPDPGDALKFKASTTDGSEMPDWIDFLTLECCFSGKAPEGLEEHFKLEIVLTATDFDGLSTDVKFKIMVEIEKI